MCAGASGVYDAFGDPLVVEMGDLNRMQIVNVNMRLNLDVR